MTNEIMQIGAVTVEQMNWPQAVVFCALIFGCIYIVNKLIFIASTPS